MSNNIQKFLNESGLKTLWNRSNEYIDNTIYNQYDCEEYRHFDIDLNNVDEYIIIDSNENYSIGLFRLADFIPLPKAIVEGDLYVAEELGESISLRQITISQDFSDITQNGNIWTMQTEEMLLLIAIKDGVIGLDDGLYSAVFFDKSNTAIAYLKSFGISFVKNKKYLYSEEVGHNTFIGPLNVKDYPCYFLNSTDSEKIYLKRICENPYSLDSFALGTGSIPVKFCQIENPLDGNYPKVKILFETTLNPGYNEYGEFFYLTENDKVRIMKLYNSMNSGNTTIPPGIYTVSAIEPSDMEGYSFTTESFISEISDKEIQKIDKKFLPDDICTKEDIKSYVDEAILGGAW